MSLTWWQVLGSNQRRLSRRFYGEPADAAVDAVYLRKRRSRREWPAAQPLLNREPP
jgi:hypothetical protein